MSTALASPTVVLGELTSYPNFAIAPLTHIIMGIALVVYFAGVLSGVASYACCRRRGTNSPAEAVDEPDALTLSSRAPVRLA